MVEIAMARNFVSTGYAKHHDTATAVSRAVGQLGPVQPTLLLVFCGGKLDPVIAMDRMREAFPGIQVVGGSAAGALSRGGCGYSGLEFGVMAFLDPSVTPAIVSNDALLAGEYEAGRALGAEVASIATDDAVTLLLFDSVASGDPLRLHFASSLVDGLQAGLGSKPIRLIGGGLLTDMNLSDGWVFDGQQVRKHVAVALVFPPGVQADSQVLHGCRPVSTFMEITRIEGAEVFELDGSPALEVIETMLRLKLGGGSGHNLSLIATLGEKQGDPFAPYDENAYVNRLILTSDRERGSVTLFEPDFHRGTRVQIMSRDNYLMLESVRAGVAAANTLLSHVSSVREPAFSLYIDCAGRASARSGAEIEEGELLIDNLDPSIPFLGFYSGVEVAPFEGYSKPLDWTGVLTTFWADR
jgi:hypothetical protein